ncbi:M15 family metallopeptidase [Arthrobacter psychrolactophilus]|nr:M15 family metallopeptidase [Arthrobacter psychrolactophilus]
MEVVGFHQSRRPRLSPGDRVRRALSWPHPGGIAVSVLGAGLIFGGALVMSPSAEPDSLVLADNAPSPSTTPEPTQLPSIEFPVPTVGEASATSSPSATLAASGADASALPSATPAPAPPLPVAGAAADSPIQKLFAGGESATLDQALRDITNPNSPLVLVNKQRPLIPSNYAPNDLVTPQVPAGSEEPVSLRAEAATATERLFAAAAAQGVAVTIKSSYRSYDVQTSLYNGYVAAKGQSAADSTSARPGFSEHQTGLALDIGDANAGTACDFDSCFAETAAAQWVAAHGAEFGFIVRYVPGVESITGYLAEPWHLRYVGVAVAQDMQKKGIASFEEYLKLPGAPDYK